MAKKKTAKSVIEERSPVIVVMGHIDHGKSTLLDFIRKTNVVEGEAGSITQHISAYEVAYEKSKGDKKKITFIDTPGHAAFCSVRSTGACIADIAILIVSAEDGVKPQMLEAYKDIKEAQIPFVIAINKIDKPNANVEKVKQELIENEIFLEGLGGDVPFTPISATTGQGVPELLETIFLVAEMEELKGDRNSMASGFVLESKMDTQKGTEIVVVVKNGTLKKGNFILINDKISPVRRLESFSGKLIDEATFSSPIRLIGVSGVPEAGTAFMTFASKKEAEAAAEEQKKEEVVNQPVVQEKISADEDEKTKISIIIKADVFGSIDAIQQEIQKVGHERAIVQVISTGVGDVSENDVKITGKTGNALIIGFNVKASQHVKDLAERQNVKVVVVDVIYKLTEWLEENINNLVPKIKVEEGTGLAKIIRIFSKTKTDQIVGGKVKEGKLTLSSSVKILRRDFEIGKGVITNIQSQKIQTKEVNEGDEFGMNVRSKVDIAEGDVLEAFKIVEK
ncbi:MAG: translation initiation factor IF-2 [Patescibacteria group bacterium]|nr:translation initiation factor IF-2 [Patescibacteria group bacterium]